DLPAYGGKMGIDATRKWPSEGYTRSWPARVSTTEAAGRRAAEIWRRVASDSAAGGRGKDKKRVATACSAGACCRKLEKLQHSIAAGCAGDRPLAIRRRVTF